jgi:hypothetical protein
MNEDTSFPRSAWERTLATLRVASCPSEGRDAERPLTAFPRGAWERGISPFYFSPRTVCTNASKLATGVWRSTP